MKIFAPNYTQTPNDLFDKWLPHLGEAELKVMLVILRQTFGWHKERDQISISQLARKTGLMEETVIKATRSLQNKGLILKEVIGPNGKQQTFYELFVEENSNNSDPSVLPRGPLGFNPPVKTEAQKKAISKETIQKKQQQAAKPPIAVAPSKKEKERPPIYPCLEKIPINDKSKLVITKRHEEAKVIKAVNVAMSKRNPPKDLAAFINWAADVDIDEPLTEEELIKQNMKYALSVESRILSQAFVNFDVLSKCVEFSFPSCQKQPIGIAYNNSKFKNDLDETLKKLGYSYK